MPDSSLPRPPRPPRPPSQQPIPRRLPAVTGHAHLRSSPRPLPGVACAAAHTRLYVLCLGLAVSLVAAVALLAPPAAAESGRWQWPTPPPHQVVNAFEQPEHQYGPGHRGIDIAAGSGTPVRAVEGGTVRFAGTVAGRGTVSVLHADGLISTYEPVSATVGEGDVVAAGTELGTLSPGSAGTGHCGDDPCLHLGARQGQAYLDPLLLLGMHGPSVLLTWTESSGPGGVGRSAAAAPAAAVSAAAPSRPSAPTARGPARFAEARPVLR